MSEVKKNILYTKTLHPDFFFGVCKIQAEIIKIVFLPEISSDRHAISRHVTRLHVTSCDFTSLHVTARHVTQTPYHDKRPTRHFTQPLVTPPTRLATVTSLNATARHTTRPIRSRPLRHFTRPTLHVTPRHATLRFKRLSRHATVTSLHAIARYFTRPSRDV